MTTDRSTALTYDESVTAAATALTQGDDANWELARLTWVSTKAAGDPASQPDKATMAEWCADVRAASNRGFSESTGRKYRMLWERHGQHFSVNRPSWTDAWQTVSPRQDEKPAPQIDTLIADDPEIRAAAVEALAADDRGHEEVFGAYIERKDREARKERLRDQEPEPVIGDVYSQLAGEMRQMREYGAVQTRIAVLARAVRAWDIHEARREFAKHNDLTPIEDTVRDLEDVLGIFRQIAQHGGRTLEVVS